MPRASLNLGSHWYCRGANFAYKMGSEGCLSSLASFFRIFPFVLFCFVFIGYKLYYDTNPMAVRFFILSDVHFDPFYEPGYNTSVRCRPPSFKSMFTSASAHPVNPVPLVNDFVDSGHFGRVFCDAPWVLVQSTYARADIFPLCILTSCVVYNRCGW